MPPPGPTRAARAVTLVAFVAFAAYLASLSLYPLANSDIWLHLATGQSVLETGRVPHTDPFSFTARGRPWTSHEWLAGVLFQLVYAAAGVPALTLFAAVIVGLSFAVHAASARRLGVGLALYLPIAAWTAYIVSARIAERPHIFSFLFVALDLHLLLRFRADGRHRHLLFVVALQALWANLHGGHIIGIALLVTFALGETLARLRQRWLGDAPAGADAVNLRFAWAVIPAAAVAACIGPHGYHSLLFPFQLTSAELFMAQNFEWLPPYLDPINRGTMFVLFHLMLGATVAAFLFAQRHAATSPGQRGLAARNRALLLAVALLYLGLAIAAAGDRWSAGVVHASLLAILALAVLAALNHTRTVDFTLVGVLLLFVLLSLRHQRLVADAAFAIHLPLATWLAAARRPGPVERGRAVMSWSSALVALALLNWRLGYQFDFAGHHRMPGLGVAAGQPICAVEFVHGQGLQGHAFVSYASAPLLVQRAHPDVLVNMDTRNEVYGEELSREFLVALTVPRRCANISGNTPSTCFC